ncbi:uncharacterized protein LOC132695600 [Cylas formicarius]|uniref:uncharacterized protein LOC132695600 n=1 Tax=Cylas formicarius TaxID=197179 RepID=UPI0029587299|nr:uncharacterized protein LOC132695600 [Cylas formicarius]
MNKLLKSVKSSSNKKDDLIKHSITTHLSNSVKEIQYVGVEEAKSSKIIDVTDASNQLCMAVEAMFLHGLRDSLTHRFKKALSDLDERPAPNFWDPLLVISHRQIIDQITNLSQISTEVGQCRAWVRLALNDCLLSSYLMTVRHDSSALKSYYNINAYLRDGDLLDIAQRLIEGVEAFKSFTLPSNSSLLNTWPLQSLILAGLWAPTWKACPVAPCDDVASMLDDEKAQIVEEASDTASLSSAVSVASTHSGLRQIVALTEDEVLKIILAKDKEAKYMDQPSSSCDELKSTCSSDTDYKNVEDNLNHNVGNSLSKRSGWSFDEQQEQDSVSDSETKPPIESSESKSMEASYTALIESYNMLSGGYIRTPDIREVWQKFEDERFEETLAPSVNPVQGSDAAQISNAILVKGESTSLVAQVSIIANERGLDYQNFECAGCRRALGVTTRPNVCGFTGEYFCEFCMSPEKMSIPARIIHNWDFKQYPVSQKSFDYINEIKDHPVIDLKIVNPFIYGAVEEMAELQKLRNQLNFLRAYLYTCRKPVIEQLQKQMWPKEYMYEHIHQYSISDLHDVTSGDLFKALEKVVQFGRDHVFNCWLCSQKGFVCEICEKPKELFPFDVENVYRCDMCYAVFHKSCLNSSKPCPKCERRKKRQELPLLGAIIVD